MTTIPQPLATIPQMMTPAERRRRARVRRILRLAAAGFTPREIASDPRVKLTPRRVRQILQQYRDALDRS